MHLDLDIQTLSVVTALVVVLLGGLFVFACAQSHRLGAPLVWGESYFVYAVGLGLVAARGTIPDWMSINVANALILLGVAQIWAGARLFEGRPVRISLVFASAVLWLAACAVPKFEADINLRVILVSLLLALLLVVTAEEFWRGRAEPLVSRWPVVLVLLAYAVVFLMRIPQTLLWPMLGGQSLMSEGAFGWISFNTLFFMLVLAFLLLNMPKERAELQYKIASLIDPLSGVANRRAFFDGAEDLQQAHEYTPLAVMVFDLDHFKEINDRFGHSDGDFVLKIFAATANRLLGEEAVFGRIGGEEFAAVLPARNLDQAIGIAQRVRQEFAREAAVYGDADIHPTVSVGVVMENDPGHAVDCLLAAADRALYCAKAAGRNRVEVADAGVLPPSVPADSVLGNRRWWPRQPAGA